MTIKSLIGNLALYRLLPWLIIIALLIMLGYCGRGFQQDRAAWKRQKATGDSTTKAQQALIIKERGEYWAAQSAIRRDSLRADSAAKAATRHKVTADQQKAEIKRLYALLGQPFDTTIDRSCCEVAIQYTNTIDSLQLADSMKDIANMQQIDIATRLADSLYGALETSNRNFRIVDSLRGIASKVSKPRAKLSAGVAGGISPGFGWGGGMIQYTGPGGTSYQVQAGPTNLKGMYYGAGVLKIISLRKKR